MSLQRVIDLLVMATLVEMMGAVGLGVTLAELAAVLKDWRLVLKAAAANYLVVPAVTLSLLWAFAPPPMVAVGFLILAACPGAPFSPLCARLAKADVGATVGVMALLAASSALSAPLLLATLLRFAAAGPSTPQVDGLRLAMTLALTQLVPLAAGLGMRRTWPRLAERLLRPATLISKLLSGLVFVLIIFAQFSMLSEIRFLGYLAMGLLLAASLGAGWLLGGPGVPRRRALALATSLRNVGPGLVIATGSFPETPAATAVVAYGIIEIVGSIALAVGWGSLSKHKEETQDEGPHHDHGHEAKGGAFRGPLPPPVDRP